VSKYDSAKKDEKYTRQQSQLQGHPLVVCFW